MSVFNCYVLPSINKVVTYLLTYLLTFSYVRKAFRPIRRDLSKLTTDFIQQVQVHCVKTSVARKLSYKSTKIPVLLTVAQGSTRFEHLEKSIDDYINEQQNKNTRAKTTRDVKLLVEFLREKHDQRNHA